jgi:hypothetical protein
MKKILKHFFSALLSQHHLIFTRNYCFKSKQRKCKKKVQRQFILHPFFSLHNKLFHSFFLFWVWNFFFFQQILYIFHIFFNSFLLIKKVRWGWITQIASPPKALSIDHVCIYNVHLSIVYHSFFSTRKMWKLIF